MCIYQGGGRRVCDGWGSFEKNDYGSLEWLSKTNGYLPWDRRSLREVIFQEEHIERCELACSCQFGDHQLNISNPSNFCSADHFHTDAPSSVFYVEGVDGQWRRGLKGRNGQPGWTPEASPGGTSIPHHQRGLMVEADQGLSWLGSTTDWPFRPGFTETWLSRGLWRLWDITEMHTVDTEWKGRHLLHIE